jgi:polar amino acid transport system substrate-binding protein
MSRINENKDGRKAALKCESFCNGESFMRKMIFVLAICVMFSFSLKKADTLAADTVITVSCCDYKPYFYEEKGEVKGYAYETARVLLEQAGFKAVFKVMPWKRVYIMGQEEKNFMLICMGRTVKREDMFQWVAPVSEGVNYNFYKLKSNPFEITSLTDLKNYRIAVERGTQMHDFLLQNDLKDSVYELSRAELTLKLLFHNRTDLVLCSEDELKSNADNLNIDFNQFEMAFAGYTVKEYMAFGKNTSPDIVQKLQRAYRELEEQGKITLY